MVCHSVPQVFIRTHQGREAVRLIGDDTGARWWNASTERLFALAEREHIDLKKEFAARMKAKAVGVWELRKHFGQDSFGAIVKRGVLGPATDESPADE